MEFSLRMRSAFAELTISTENAKITEDLASRDALKNTWCVDEQTIAKFVTVANELSRYNGTADIEFVKTIIGAFLNDSELAELIDYLTES